MLIVHLSRLVWVNGLDQLAELSVVLGRRVEGYKTTADIGGRNDAILREDVERFLDLGLVVCANVVLFGELRATLLRWLRGGGRFALRRLQ